MTTAADKFKEFGTLKEHLSGSKTAQGEDLYQHVSNIMGHIVVHCPEDALNKIEEISYLLKNKSTLDIEQWLKVNEIHNYAKPSDECTKAATQEPIKNGMAHFQVEKTTNEDGEEVEAGGAGPIGNIPDLLADSKVWQWAGVGFGEYDTMLLQKSMKKLIVSSGASNLKFWGKIKGTEKDYFVAEGTQEAGEPAEGEEASTEAVEPRGQGVNKFVYWVCNSPLEAWTQLPDLKPSNIISAR